MTNLKSNEELNELMDKTIAALPEEYLEIARGISKLLEGKKIGSSLWCLSLFMASLCKYNDINIDEVILSIKLIYEDIK